jgi:hypothetical protein
LFWLFFSFEFCICNHRHSTHYLSPFFSFLHPQQQHHNLWTWLDCCIYGVNNIKLFVLKKNIKLFFFTFSILFLSFSSSSTVQINSILVAMLDSHYTELAELNFKKRKRFKYKIMLSQHELMDLYYEILNLKFHQILRNGFEYFETVLLLCLD